MRENAGGVRHRPLPPTLPGGQGGEPDWLRPLSGQSEICQEAVLVALVDIPRRDQGPIPVPTYSPLEGGGNKWGRVLREVAAHPEGRGGNRRELVGTGRAGQRREQLVAFPIKRRTVVVRPCERGEVP